MPANLLTDEIRHTLHGTCLFYPCSGRDILAPVNLFAPYINSFWFADIAYFPTPGAANTETPILKISDGFEFISDHVRDKLVPEADWLSDPKYRGVEPCTRSEVYKHVPSSAEVTIHRTRRRGPSALRSLTEPLGVFFFRGDSDEGRSGTLWLNAKKRKGLFLEVLAHLIDHGLIATDGSLCEDKSTNPYKHFAQVAAQWPLKTTNIHDASFCDREQRRFEFLGQVSTRFNRPTLLWQVSGGSNTPK